MTTIFTKLNAQQFKAAFGDHELVKNLSDDAINYCLEAIERLQESVSGAILDIDWQEVFKDGVEITDKELVERYKDTLIQYDDHLVTVASTVKFDGELAVTMENEDGVSNYMLIKNNLPALLEYPDFVAGAAGVLGRDNFWHCLENGKWFKLV